MTTEEARDAFRSSLTDAEDWLYSDGEAEAAAAFRAKLKTLTAVGDPMTRRAAEYEDRPKVVDAARKAVELDIKVVRGWEASKPYINETERAGALAKLEAFEGWLADKMAEQAKRADTEEPAFTAGQVQVEYAKAAAEFQRLSRRKPPKPPAAAPGAAAGGANGTATNGTTAGANSTSSSAGEEAPGAEQQQQQEGEAEAEGGGAADGEGQQQQGEAEADEELPTHEEL